MRNPGNDCATFLHIAKLAEDVWAKGFSCLRGSTYTSPNTNPGMPGGTTS